MDADLNYVGAAGPDELGAERSRVIAAATAVAEGQGYRVAVTTDAHALSGLTLLYRGTQGVQGTLKLEVNYMYRAPLGLPAEREARMTFDPPLHFKVVSFAELVGGKLVALLDRTAARDLYDAAALAATVDVEDRLVRRVFVAMAGNAAASPERLPGREDRTGDFARHTDQPISGAGLDRSTNETRDAADGSCAGACSSRPTRTSPLPSRGIPGCSGRRLMLPRSPGGHDGRRDDAESQDLEQSERLLRLLGACDVLDDGLGRGRWCRWNEEPRRFYSVVKDLVAAWTCCEAYRGGRPLPLRP